MALKIGIKKGFDINLQGSISDNIVNNIPSSSFAIKPDDFIGITRPKLLVKSGDEVVAGSPLMYDKLSDDVMYTSPVSGEIADIIRGEKRKIEEIRILADKKNRYLEFQKFSQNDIEKMSKEVASELLKKSGCWLNIIQRPYGMVAEPNAIPKAIFISCFDTHPLATSYKELIKENKNYIQAGIDIMKKFTNGDVHLNCNEIIYDDCDFKGVQKNIFTGPHPAGNVGVQIHHIDPINKGDVVWTINPYGLSQIGRLFLNGIYDSSKVISVVGSEVKNPGYFRVNIGTNVNEILKGNIKNDDSRVISGNILTGTSISSNGYLGFYDDMITVIPEGNHYDFLGWIKPVFNKLSFHRAFGLFSFLNAKKKYILDTNTNGELRAFVQTGEFEKVLPMDILPTYLFKSILANDYDEMEELGIYELIEEDVALCEFIDVSKNDLQSLLRKGLNLLKEG